MIFQKLITLYRRSPSRWQWWGFGFAVAVVLLVLAWPALHFNFLSDEYDWLRNARLAVTSGHWFQTFTTSTGGNFYRPIVSLGFQLDYALFGSATFGYHLHQVLGQLALTLGFAWVVFLLFRSRMLSYAAAFLFALWPSQHEVVTWLAGRPDLYATLFTVYAIGCFAMHLKTKQWAWYVGSCLLAVLGYLSKETAFVLPALLLGAGLVVLPKRSWKAVGHLGLLVTVPAVLLAGVLLLRSYVLSDAIGGYLVGGERSGTNFTHVNFPHLFTSSWWWVNWTHALDRFGTQGFVGLSSRAFTWVTATWWLPVSLGLAWLLAWRWRNPVSERRRATLTGLGWAIVAFIPVYGLSGAINHSLNASRLFFSSTLGYALVLGAVLVPLAQSRRLGTVVRYTLFGCLCIAFATLWRFNLGPWHVASDKMGQVTAALAAQQNDYLAGNPTHLFVEKLPLITDGAYIFFGRVPIAEVFFQVTGRDDVQVYNVGEYAFPSSPFCERPAYARFSRIAWDSQQRYFVIAPTASVEGTLAAAGSAAAPVAWDFRDSAVVRDWDFGAYPHQQQLDGVAVDFGAAPAQELTSPRFRSQPGPAYRWLTVRYTAKNPNRAFGWRRARVLWGLDGSFPARNKLSYSFANDTAGAYAVPLCQYVVWPLTTAIDQLKVLPALSGEVILQSLTLSTERPLLP